MLGVEVVVLFRFGGWECFAGVEVVVLFHFGGWECFAGLVWPYLNARDPSPRCVSMMGSASLVQLMSSIMLLMEPPKELKKPFFSSTCSRVCVCVCVCVCECVTVCVCVWGE